MSRSAQIPAVRFAGFSGVWEERKFSDLVRIRRGLTYKPSDIRKIGVRVLRSSNIDEDVFILKEDDVFVDSKAINIEYAKRDDILITSANGSSRLVGKHAIISKIADTLTVHGGFMLIGTTSEPYFINASMSSFWYKRFIELYVSGGNGAIGNLSKSDLDSQIFLVPSFPEQTQIGTYFKYLDTLITQQQKKCEKLANVKKAMLEKMFPKKGSKVPEIRFAGFEGEWEEKKLGECATISKGTQLNKSVLFEYGSYYVLNGGMTPSGYTNSYNTEKDTISISEGGNSCGFVNYNIERFWSGGHNYTLSNIQIDCLYLYAFLKYKESSIMALRVGSGLPNIQKNRLIEVDILYPSLPEQTKIGKYFEKLDVLITLQRRKLDKLKNIKKSLLQRMFPGA